jgi:hypothetical protein
MVARRSRAEPEVVAEVLAALEPWRPKFRRLNRLRIDVNLPPSERSASAVTPPETGPWDEDSSTHEERVDHWMREAAGLASEITDHDPTIDQRLRHAIEELCKTSAQAGSLAAEMRDAWKGQQGGEDLAFAFGQPGRAWFWFLEIVARVVDGWESVKPPRKQMAKDNLSPEAKAVATLVDHPEWSHAQIAQAAGCARRSLYRFPKFMRAREVQRSSREGARRNGSRNEKRSEGGDDESE